MIRTFLAVAGLAALLSACAHAPATASGAQPEAWNGGVWNSVLGYHGPANVITAGAP